MKNKTSINFLLLIGVSACYARDSSKILKDVCKNNPNIRHLNFDYQGYEEIDENAFQNCTEVEHIQLRWNNWLHIPKNTFKNKGLHKLHTLWILGGNLSTINLDLSDLGKLRELEFSDLKTKIIRTETFTGISNLETLWIYSNDLLDIDIEGILRHSPKLKTVYLNDNNFKCDRLREISLLIFPRFHPNGYLKKRDYTPLNVNGFKCLSQDQWDMEMKRSGLESYSLGCLRGEADCNCGPKPDEGSKVSKEIVGTLTNFGKDIEGIRGGIEMIKEVALYYVIEKLDTLIINQGAENKFYRQTFNFNQKLNDDFMKFEVNQLEKLASMDKKFTKKIETVQNTLNEILDILKNEPPTSYLKSITEFIDNEN